MLLLFCWHSHRSRLYYDYFLSYCDTNQIIFIFVYDASLYTYFVSCNTERPGKKLMKSYLKYFIWQKICHFQLGAIDLVLIHISVINLSNQIKEFYLPLSRINLLYLAKRRRYAMKKWIWLQIRGLQVNFIMQSSRRYFQ